jgi:hypothetical protein
MMIASNGSVFVFSGSLAVDTHAPWWTKTVSLCGRLFVVLARRLQRKRSGRPRQVDGDSTPDGPCQQRVDALDCRIRGVGGAYD